MTNVRAHELHQLMRSWLLAEDPYGMNQRQEPTFGTPQPTMATPATRSRKRRAKAQSPTQPHPLLEPTPSAPRTTEGGPSTANCKSPRPRTQPAKPFKASAIRERRRRASKPSDGRPLHRQPPKSTAPEGRRGARTPSTRRSTRRWEAAAAFGRPAKRPTQRAPSASKPSPDRWQARRGERWRGGVSKTRKTRTTVNPTNVRGGLLYSGKVSVVLAPQGDFPSTASFVPIDAIRAARVVPVKAAVVSVLQRGRFP